MIRAKVQAETLADYYAQLTAAQCRVHGQHYCAHHDVIRRLAGECHSYVELGVNEGATLACALLAGYSLVVGVDVSLAPLSHAARLFHGAVLIEQDSRRPLGVTYDVLFIDSLHTAEQMRAELAGHGLEVTRYILAHDTTAKPVLFRELKRWAAANRWTVQCRDTRGHGHTLLKRQA